jgi:AraC-like DNA-binding protein
MLNLRYFSPSSALSAFIRRYYFVDGQAADGALQDRLMPAAAATLRFQRKGNWTFDCAGLKRAAFPSAAFVGPTSTIVTVSTDEDFKLFGIDLTALGQVMLTRVPMDELTDQCRSLTDVLEVDWSELEARIANASTDSAIVDETDAFLLRKLAHRQHIGVRSEGLALIDVVERAGGRYTQVSSIAHRLGLSERQVERLSRQFLGFAPSLALRRARFINAVDAIIAAPDASWIDVAGEGYFDQSHFVREFRTFCGMTPGQFARRQSLFLAAVEPVLPSTDRDIRLPVNGYRTKNDGNPKQPKPERWSCDARSTMEFVAVA